MKSRLSIDLGRIDAVDKLHMEMQVQRDPKRWNNVTASV